MLLSILRHAEAGSAATDAQRPLTARGREDARALGRWLAPRRALQPLFVLHSPYCRAQETAELVLEALPEAPPPEVFARMRPEDPPAAILPRLRELRGPALLVGHNPHLSLLASWLITGRLDALPIIDLDKCAWVQLERLTADGLPGHWALRGLLGPDHYRD